MREYRKIVPRQLSDGGVIFAARTYLADDIKMTMGLGWHHWHTCSPRSLDRLRGTSCGPVLILVQDPRFDPIDTLYLQHAACLLLAFQYPPRVLRIEDRDIEL